MRRGKSRQMLGTATRKCAGGVKSRGTLIRSGLGGRWWRRGDGGSKREGRCEGDEDVHVCDECRGGDGCARCGDREDRERGRPGPRHSKVPKTPRIEAREERDTGSRDTQKSLRQSRKREANCERRAQPGERTRRRLGRHRKGGLRWPKRSRARRARTRAREREK